MSTNKVTFLNKNKEKLVGILEGSGKKGVIFLHGFTGNKDEWGRFGKISEKLAQDGFLVLRFDFSGNGESDGIFEESHFEKQTTDALSAIAFMKKQGCTSIGLYGHSMGGAVAILAGAKAKVNAVTVTAAAALPDPVLLAQYARDWVNKELPPDFLENVASTNVMAAAGELKAPLLIIHGDKDTIVDVSASKELYAHANEPKSLVIVKGADHDFAHPHEAQRAIEEIVAWMKKYL